MARIRIVTDSASDIPSGMYPGVTVVPLAVTFGDETYLDGVTLTHQQFYDKLIESDELPTTSMVSPGEFSQVFAEAAEAGEDVVAVVLSSKLSGTYESALLAARQFPGRVHVADTMNATLGERIQVEYALRLRDEGLDAASIARQVEGMRDRVRTIGVLDTLEYLKKGGRVTPAAAAMGTVLGIKPLLTIRGEKLDTFAKVRGTKQCKARLLEAMKKSVAEYRARGWDIRVDASGSFDRREEEEEWRALAAQAFPGEPIQYDPLTLSIASHTGPGAFAMGISRRIPA